MDVFSNTICCKINNASQACTLSYFHKCVGNQVGGIDTYTEVTLVAQAIGTLPSRGFGMAFWVELEKMLGPVFGPIIRGIFEQVWRTLEDPSFRTTILSTIIWTFLAGTLKLTSDLSEDNS